MYYKPFYQFVLTYTDPHKRDDQTLFANIVANDVGFPRQEVAYNDIVNYIELTDEYSRYLHVFDELWGIYVELNRV